MAGDESLVEWWRMYMDHLSTLWVRENKCVDILHTFIFPKHNIAVHLWRQLLCIKMKEYIDKTTQFDK